MKIRCDLVGDIPPIALGKLGYSASNEPRGATMTLLMKSLADWRSPAFSRTLKQELEHLPTGILPLAEATGQGGFVDDSDISVSVFNSHDEGTAIHAKVGVFFTEIVVGCGCGVDPMEINAYCEMQVSIDKETAKAVFKVLAE